MLTLMMFINRYIQGTPGGVKYPILTGFTNSELLTEFTIWYMIEWLQTEELLRSSTVSQRSEVSDNRTVTSDVNPAGFSSFSIGRPANPVGISCL